MKQPLFLKLLCIISTAGVIFASDQNWPQFRGLAGNGVSSETGLVNEWSAEGPKILWKISIGEGFSGVSVADGICYTMDARMEPEPFEYAVAYRASSGEEIWRTKMNKKFDEEFGNGPRVTPTVVGDKVLVLDSLGKFAALSIADGKEIWAVDLQKDFKSKFPRYGYSTSPIVSGDRIILEVGGAEGKRMMAFNIDDGKVLWGTQDGNSLYNTPLPVSLFGQKQFVFVTPSDVQALDDNGVMLWSFKWPGGGEAISSPVYVPPNKFFVSNPNKGGATLFEVNKNSDIYETKDVWSNRVMKNHFSSSIFYKGHIYGFDNATLKCINATDGSIAWSKRRYGKGALILADGKLFILSDRGLLVMAEAAETGFKELGSVQALQGKCWTAPSLSAGKLFLRNHQELVCIDLKAS